MLPVPTKHFDIPLVHDLPVVQVVQLVQKNPEKIKIISLRKVLQTNTQKCLLEK